MSIAGESTVPDVTNLRRVMGWLALPYLAFVIYGSLVPLRYTPRDWAGALAAYESMPFAKYGIESRLDWAVNVMLFVPLAFLVFGSLDRGPARRIWLIPLVLMMCVALASGIEFTQLWFPPRVTALNDIVAESAGAMIGIGLWLWRGPAIAGHAVGWALASHKDGRWTSAFYSYLAILFLFNLMPLDLTVSLHEIWDKWKEGRILVIPFQVRGDRSEVMLGWIMDILAWIPVGALAVRARVGQPLRLWGLCIGIAALLEGLQLIVFSRITDTTDIVTAALGAGLGISATRALGFGAREATAGSRVHSSRLEGVAQPLWWLAAIGYSMALTIAFWFPYDFRIDASFARARLAALEQLPLFGLFAGSELRAIGNILQKSALYIPLGMLLGRACVDRKGSKSIIAVLIAVTWGLLLPLGIELGQLLLPDKYPDATDWLLALCGVTVGGVVVTGSFSARPFASRNERGPGIGRWLVAWAAASGLVATVTHLPGVPYNVREALDPALGAFGPVTFGAFLMWMVAFQIVTPRSLPPRKPGRGFYYWPTMLLVHSIIGTLMLSVAATRESLEDIAGSPVLGWAGNIELLARTSVLIAATSWLFLGGSLFASRREAGRSRRQLFLIWLTISIGLLPLFYWISIDQAATDNLTELVAGNGAPWATALIALWAVLVSAAGASLSQLGRNSRWFASVAVVLASIAVGFVLLQAGMAPAIVKYGQAFSGLQFLLSPDRTHYVDWSSLFLRYSLVHLTLVVAIAVCREWLDPARVRSNVLAGSSDTYQRQQHAEASGIRRNF